MPAMGRVGEGEHRSGTWAVFCAKGVHSGGGVCPPRALQAAWSGVLGLFPGTVLGLRVPGTFLARLLMLSRLREATWFSAPTNRRPRSSSSSKAS